MRHKSLLFFLFLVPYSLFSQQDRVILPDVELSIGDQSAVETTGTTEALLNDRNPVFEQVFLEELGSANKSGVQNTDTRYIYAVQNKDITLFRFAYGYFHQTEAYAEFQRKAGDLVYNLFYKNFSRQYASVDSKYYINSDMLTNSLGLSLSGAINGSSLDGFIGYQQERISFSSAQFTRLGHYVPLSFKSKHWLNDTSFIRFDTESGIFTQEHNNTGVLRAQSMGDIKATISYDASFKPWYNFRLSSSVFFQGYNFSLADYSGLFTFVNEFLLPKGFRMMLGLTLAPHKQFYAWPEFALGYEFLEYLKLTFSISGELSHYTAKNAIEDTQSFFSPSALDSRTVLRASFTTMPHPFTSFNAYVQYNFWQTRQNFEYNGTFYHLIQDIAHNTLAAGAGISLQYPNIFDLKLNYHYENIPQHFLLLPHHRLTLSMGLGWKPAGFLFETIFTLRNSGNLSPDKKISLYLLDMKVTQRLHQSLSVYLEFNNILNTDAFFWADLPYGGFQIRGGVQVFF